jgi:hypothetical protein
MRMDLEEKIGLTKFITIYEEIVFYFSIIRIETPVNSKHFS